MVCDLLPKHLHSSFIITPFDSFFTSSVLLSCHILKICFPLIHLEKGKNCISESANYTFNSVEALKGMPHLWITGNLSVYVSKWHEMGLVAK